MKSWILIVSYLWKDTWSRWREQPSTVLARVFVGMLLVAVATVILAGFTILERSVRERLERFGLNTLVVREMIQANDPELFYNTERPDRLAPLSAAGTRLRFRQLFVRAQTEWQRDMLVMAYAPEALPILARSVDLECPLVCLSDTLPEGVQMKFTLDRQPGVAVIHRFSDMFRPLGVENLLLVPQGWCLDAERIGYLETSMFERGGAGYPMHRYVEAVGLLYALDRRPPPQMQSALPLIRELENLQARQRQWRGLLAGGLGLAVALVFGAIAILEFRQNLFVGALLRSLGAPGRFLYFRQWAENALIANAAALVAIGLVMHFHHEIFGGLGFAAKALDLAQGNPYWSGEMLLILCWVNVGAFLSSLPVAVGLRRPVGAILN